jgi:hypothetical protein
MELTYILKYYMVLYADLSYIYCIIDIEFIVLNILQMLLIPYWCNQHTKYNTSTIAHVLLLIMVYIIYQGTTILMLSVVELLMQINACS